MKERNKNKNVSHQQKAIVAGTETLIFGAASLVFPPAIIAAGVTAIETIRQEDLDIQEKADQQEHKNPLRRR